MSKKTHKEVGLTTKSPIYSINSESTRVVLTEPLEVVVNCNRDKHIEITIPEGFEWDGASIPRLFWSVVGSPYSPKFITASLVHDYLIHIDWDGASRDQTFYQILLGSGVSYSKSYLMWKSVVYYRKVKSLFS